MIFLTVTYRHASSFPFVSGEKVGLVVFFHLLMIELNGYLSGI